MKIPMQEQAKQTIEIAKVIPRKTVEFIGIVISNDPVEYLKSSQDRQRHPELYEPAERSFYPALYIGSLVGGVLINQARQNFEKVKPLPSRAADFMGNRFFSIAPVEAFKNWQEAVKRDREIAIGRQKALRVLEKLSTGQPMEEYDESGIVIGNAWDSFKEIPHSITYGDMGLTEEQVDRLEDKIFWTDNQ